MRLSRPIIRCLFWGLCLLPLGRLVGADSNLPPAEIIVSNVLARISLVSSNERAYGYMRKLVVEELDDRGAAKSRKEKEYSVTLLGGVPYLQLTKVDGRELPQADLRAEDDRDRKIREQADVNRPRGRKGDGTGYFTPEIAARFVFKTEREEVIEGRRCWVVSFRAKPDQPAKKLSERVVNKLTGYFWVDQEESEIVNVKAELSERIALWGGFAGALDVFRFSMQRARGVDGMWFNKHGSLRVEGRKLLSAIRFTATEEGSGFKRTEKKPAGSREEPKTSP